MSKRPGVLTLSLDFELHWGTRDHRSLESYRQNILGGRDAVPKMLERFARRGIHATWAAVGMMFFESRQELVESLPARVPRYADPKLSPYEALHEVGEDEERDPFHFAPSLLKRIAETPHQELATHTFSHYYCLERGQSAADFRADLDAAREVARRKLGLQVRSLVFPRNQFNSDYLSVCSDAGIQAYRGNPRSWVYEPRNGEEESLPRRGLRLLDSYVNLTGHHGHDLSRLAAPAGAAMNVPASRFLRPCSRKLRTLEPLRLKRIERDLEHCAREGLLYHLWWHPDNFGTRTEENLGFLDAVLDRFERLRSEHGMMSLNMGEVRDLAGA